MTTAKRERDERSRARNSDWEDLSGTWVGPMLVVNFVPREQRRGGGKGPHAVWRCWHADKRRDIYLRTAEVKRLIREREAESRASGDARSAGGGPVSIYRDRTGQRVGSLEVLEDTGRRTRRGAVLWRCLDHTSGCERFLTTARLIRLDRKQLAREANG